MWSLRSEYIFFQCNRVCCNLLWFSACKQLEKGTKVQTSVVQNLSVFCPAGSILYFTYNYTAALDSSLNLSERMIWDPLLQCSASWGIPVFPPGPSVSGVTIVTLQHSVQCSWAQEGSRSLFPIVHRCIIRSHQLAARQSQGSPHYHSPTNSPQPPPSRLQIFNEHLPRLRNIMSPSEDKNIPLILISIKSPLPKTHTSKQFPTPMIIWRLKSPRSSVSKHAKPRWMKTHILSQNTGFVMDFGVLWKIEDDSAFTKYIWRLVQSMKGRELWWSQKWGLARLW